MTSPERALVVVPCYNEEERLDGQRFDAFLAEHRDVGLVLVNDGSADGTLGILETIAERCPDRVTVVDQQPNQGKAEAVRRGLIVALEKDARYVGYWDADLATPLEAIPELAAIMDRFDTVDIVLGARVALLGRRIERSAARHYLGRIFATAASITLAIPVYDTQCGAKLLRHTTTVRRCLDEPFGSRWIFDVELLARYLSLQEGVGSADGIYEHPLRSWRDVGESKVKARDFVRAIGEMASIFRRYPLQKKWRPAYWLLGPFARYVAAGGVGTTFHYATLALLVEAFGIIAPVATTAGALVGAMVNYGLNYHFTFVSRAPHRATLPRFLTVAALVTWLNATGMWLGSDLLGLHYMLTQVGCTAGVLLVGFLLNRSWSFAVRKQRVLSSRVTDDVTPVLNPASTDDAG